eukprot:8692557-Pyramimonas_sp.AAC.1
MARAMIFPQISWRLFLFHYVPGHDLHPPLLATPLLAAPEFLYARAAECGVHPHHDGGAGDDRRHVLRVLPGRNSEVRAADGGSDDRAAVCGART